MKLWFFKLITLLLFVPGLNAENITSRLEYLPNIPIIQCCELVIELNQSFPGLKLNTQAHQTLTALLSVAGERSSIPVLNAPLTLNFTLKDLKVDLKVNDEETKFDVNDPTAALEIALLARIVDRPIQLHFDSHFVLEDHPEELKQILWQSPMLQEFYPQSLIQELFQHLFAIAGQDVAAGMHLQRQGPKHPLTGIAPQIYYEITSANDQEVQASFNGKIDKQTVSLSHPPTEGNPRKPMELTLSGNTNGRVVWNRHHALVYHLNAEYLYEGVFKVGGMDWPITIKIYQKIESKKS
jgi:hypothetical protein